MAYKWEKEESGDYALVYDGWENGIGQSPHKGVGNIQNGNISTETGEVMVSFARTQQSQFNTNANGTITPLDSTHLTLSITGGNINAGVWINVSASTITNLSTGNYYVLQNANGFTSAQLSSSYNGTPLSSLGLTGTATFSLIRNMGKPIASAMEPYSDGTNFQYRYYILDINGLVWVYDTATANSSNGLTWFLPDRDIAYYGSSTPSGMSILNGWIHVLSGNTIWCKPTVSLDTTWANFASGLMISSLSSPNPHFAFTGHQGKMYYTDGNFIGSIFPNSSLLSGGANVQSYASFTTSTTTGTITALIGGSIPTFGGTSTGRIPVAFFASVGGSTATATVAGTIYWIQYALGAGTTGTFQVFANQTGGAALDITTGASGTQYFNTYYPTSAGGEATITFSPERLNLPFFEIAQCIGELGNQVIIGTKSNSLYPWNQIDVTPGDLIPLPENNSVNMTTVNNMVYVFAGSKGNIYVTNGSTASLVISIPDYCAGIAGIPASYIEPYFTWGGSMYLRGRVYFSVLDQTSSKAGNCGGVWSFVPTQNFFVGQDTGLSLRLENQNSYGTYNGVATILLPSQNQTAIAPQFWSGWYSSITSPSYGIDFTGTGSQTVCIVETDYAETGTMLEKQTFKQIEYKLSAPLVQGESISMKYRLNSTDAFVTCGTVNQDSSTSLSGYFSTPFEKTQWLQLQATLNPLTSSSGSYVRLKEIRVR